MSYELKFHGADVLLERVIHASREVVFFFGSALTIPEEEGKPGVPSVNGVVSLIEEELASSPDAFGPVQELVAQRKYGEAYRLAFSQLHAFRGQDAANRIIRRAVFKARKKHQTVPDLDDLKICEALDKDVSGWNVRHSLRALGMLLTDSSGRLGRTVITTNFDPLIQVAIQGAGGNYFRTMLHADGSLIQSNGPGVQIVHLHGYWWGTDTLHTPNQIGQPRPNLKSSLKNLLQNRTLVVMGCGGWDDIFMASLGELLTDPESNPDVLWAFYESDSEVIQTSYERLLVSFGPALARSRVQLYSGVNLHDFFPALYERLKNNSVDETQLNIILEKLQELSPELQDRVREHLDPELTERVEILKSAQAQLEQELEAAREQPSERVADLERLAADLTSDLQNAKSSLSAARLALTSAAMKDISWLEIIRTQMMPKEPGRVPFHNDAEVAIRGFSISNLRSSTPKLHKVTWSKLPYIEKYHRGYRAGILFHGADFAPGITIHSRKIGSHERDYSIQPNIYFGNYLELSASESAPEAPLSHRGIEYQVRNPNGNSSEWVGFSYPFDDSELEQIYRDSKERGEILIGAGEYKEAIEPLRRAWVFSSRIPHLSPESEQVEKMWIHARDMAVRVELRFVEGERVLILKGEHAGSEGVISSINTNQLSPYWVDFQSGETDAFQDVQLEKT
ncbi:SIR2 family protein [Pseudomonas fluorescens]|uniref:SIR2 family protein n=1 Tax=Pseudomonas fluorescens TaxID=294 RepID=UPI0009BD0672|nr:SIR2 family protein [Pseudomonas fluorescens]